jgi:hypothetical protein
MSPTALNFSTQPTIFSNTSLRTTSSPLLLVYFHCLRIHSVFLSSILARISEGAILASIPWKSSSFRSSWLRPLKAFSHSVVLVLNQHQPSTHHKRSNSYSCINFFRRTSVLVTTIEAMLESVGVGRPDEALCTDPIEAHDMVSAVPRKA